MELPIPWARYDGDLSGPNIFPLFFCATRWVEDRKVAERLLEIWPHISKIVAFWLKLPESQESKCKSFESVKKAFEDELTTVKLSFFSYLASIFQPYLAKYQTQAPMIPYMYSDIVKIADCCEAWHYRWLYVCPRSPKD